MAYVTAQEIVDRYDLDYLTVPSDKNDDGLPDIAVSGLLLDAVFIMFRIPLS